MLTWTSLDIICSPGPAWKNVTWQLHRNVLSEMFLLCAWPEKAEAVIWWMELWQLSFSNEAERKVSLFQCGTSDNRHNCSLKSACVDKYALWWAEKLSNCTVFLLLLRAYWIHNHRTSQNHASQTHSSTVSIFVGGHTALGELSREKKKKKPVRENGGVSNDLRTVMLGWGI